MPFEFPQCRVGDPQSYRGLAVFPLFTTAPGGSDYLLGKEAIRAKSVVVEEVSEAGSVPDLVVNNRGDRRVLFLEPRRKRPRPRRVQGRTLGLAKRREKWMIGPAGSGSV